MWFLRSKSKYKWRIERTFLNFFNITWKQFYAFPFRNKIIKIEAAQIEIKINFLFLLFLIKQLKLFSTWKILLPSQILRNSFLNYFKSAKFRKNRIISINYLCIKTFQFHLFQSEENGRFVFIFEKHCSRFQKFDSVKFRSSVVKSPKDSIYRGEHFLTQNPQGRW